MGLHIFQSRQTPLLVLALLFLHPWGGIACDFCNCLMGLNPYYTSSDIVSITFLSQRSTFPGSDGASSAIKLVAGGLSPSLYHSTGNGEAFSETRNTFEVALQHHFSDNIMATAFLPVTFINATGGAETTAQGIGDVTLLGEYVVHNVFSNKLPSTIVIGGGIELPTGNNELRNSKGERLEPSTQPGSESVDVVLHVLATAQWDEWTTAVDIYGKLNSANNHNDKIGNSLSLSATLNRDVVRNNETQFAIIGLGGVRNELAAKDEVAEELDTDTGFASLYALLGGSVAYQSIRLNFSALMPIHQSRTTAAPNEGVRLMSELGLQF